VNSTAKGEIAYARYVYAHTHKDDTTIRAPVANFWATRSHTLRAEAEDEFRQMCLEFPQFGYDVLSEFLLAGKIMHIFANISNSSCSGREAQAREARKVAPVHPYTRQLSKACSRHLDLSWEDHLSGVWSHFVSHFKLSSHLYNKSYPFLASVSVNNQIKNGWEFVVIHRCINKQKLLYNSFENVKMRCKHHPVIYSM
jgi:hypothetical protein